MPKNIKLADIDTRAPKGMDKDAVKGRLQSIRAELEELQNLLFAEGKHAVLVILQGMDASGKDGLVKDVFTSINPQGISVKSFKVPTEEELSHDFLWRIHQHMPARGMIQVFNRSQYEDVLVTRVHGIIDNETAKARMRAINDFERMVAEHNNTLILKFYLHISPQEQHKRLTERMQVPGKMWKHNAGDFKESESWDDYRGYYEEIFKHCNDIPWHIVPADQNWYKSYVVASKLRDALKKLKMKYPGMKPSA